MTGPGPRYRRRKTRTLATRLAGALLAGVLASCATPGANPVLATGAGEVATVKAAGRFSLTYTEQQPETKTESASGTFDLYRDASGLSVSLSSPLGQTIAQAEHRKGAPALLTTQDGQRIEGSTLDEVFERAIGIRVPAEKLPDWLTDRFEKVIERSADGTHLSATDSGWQIDRRGGRWTLVWHEGSRRIEVRLFVDAG